MGVDLLVPIPKDKPILLDLSIWSGPLKFGGLSELFLRKDLKAPIHQDSEVHHPLSEAGIRRVRSIYRERRTRAMEDSRIMRTNVERKIGQITNAIVTKGGTDGQDHRRAYAPKHRAVILEDGITNQLGEPYRVLNHRAFRLLSDNDPSVIQDWVRDDTGIRRPLF